MILVGLGHLGFRVAQELHDLGQDVVAVERDPTADLLAAGDALAVLAEPQTLARIRREMR